VDRSNECQKARKLDVAEACALLDEAERRTTVLWLLNAPARVPTGNRGRYVFRWRRGASPGRTTGAQSEEIQIELMPGGLQIEAAFCHRTGCRNEVAPSGDTYGRMRRRVDLPPDTTY